MLHAHNRWFDPRAAAGDLWRSWARGVPAGDRLMPPHLGVGGLTLHVFTRREVLALLCGEGFRVVEARPISTRPDGRLPLPWLLPTLRAYGYLVAAEKT